MVPAGRTRGRADDQDGPDVLKDLLAVHGQGQRPRPGLAGRPGGDGQDDPELLIGAWREGVQAGRPGDLFAADVERPGQRNRLRVMRVVEDAQRPGDLLAGREGRIPGIFGNGG